MCLEEKVITAAHVNVNDHMCPPKKVTIFWNLIPVSNKRESYQHIIFNDFLI